MVTSVDLISQYCKQQHLTLLDVTGSDRFTLENEILYLTNEISDTYTKMANIDTKYLTRINRVVKIRLLVDVSLDNELIPRGAEMQIIHFEKNNPITNLKRKYLYEFFNWIKETFNERLSTSFVTKNTMPQIIGKIKQTRNKIYWQELTTQLVPILNELKEYNIDATLTIDKLALRNNKYVWNWL